jgi:hypothetical protein
MSTLLIILIIIAALALIPALMSKTFSMEETIVINKPSNVVFDYLKHIKNQDHYNTWSMMDPDMEKTYTGTDGTVGFISTWDSHKPKGPGKGEQEIKQIEEGKRLDVELRFIKPFANVCPAWFSAENIGNGQTKAAWGISGKMPYPMNFMITVFGMNKQMAKELQNGLGRLKTILEKE